jgi:ABC-type nitrate/sulfonate/bicarbonate transport system ATPase subunit
MNSTGVSIHIQDLCLTRGNRELYRHFSLDISANEVLALIAPSGHGKTTLLDFIGGILPSRQVSFTGTLSFEGQGISGSQKPRISYLFQDGLLIESATVLQNVVFPLVNISGKKEAYDRAVFFLQKAGLADKLDSFPGCLSGGEKQRAAIARAFAYPSQLLLMDEAFQSQDIYVKIQLMELLDEMLSETGRTVLFVTHEIREAVTVAGRILVLDSCPVQVLLDTKNRRNLTTYTDPDDDTTMLEKRITGLLAKHQYMG